MDELSHFQGNLCPLLLKMMVLFCARVKKTFFCIFFSDFVVMRGSYDRSVLVSVINWTNTRAVRLPSSALNTKNRGVKWGASYFLVSQYLLTNTHAFNSICENS